jgi:hypothetical protein
VRAHSIGTARSAIAFTQDSAQRVAEVGEELRRQRTTQQLRRGDLVERTETLASTTRVLAVYPGPAVRRRDRRPADHRHAVEVGQPVPPPTGSSHLLRRPVSQAPVPQPTQPSPTSDRRSRRSAQPGSLSTEEEQDQEGRTSCISGPRTRCDGSLEVASDAGDMAGGGSADRRARRRERERQRRERSDRAEAKDAPAAPPPQTGSRGVADVPAHSDRFATASPRTSSVVRARRRASASTAPTTSRSRSPAATLRHATRSSPVATSSGSGWTR